MGEGSGTMLEGVQCEGHESRLVDCKHSSAHNDVSCVVGRAEVWVSCDPVPNDGPMVRLVGGASPNTGRLEFRHLGLGAPCAKMVSVITARSSMLKLPAESWACMVDPMLQQATKVD